jgi:tripartite-type tricarboxylate transporter receptor subunit TctC
MKSKKSSSLVRAIGAVGFAVFVGHSVAAQVFPDKPIRVVVAFAAGGFADSNARMIGQKLADRFGQPVVIDNRGGAGGTLGAKIVVDATPDGYTLLATTAASSITPSLYKNVGFDLLKDLTPVANTVSAAGVFSVLASHPAGNLKDLIERSRGRRLNFATAGVGTSSHIAADYLLRVLAKLDAVHVPFKGGGPAVIAVLGNQVELLNSSGAALAHIRAGRMKALGVASLTRVSSMPDVPTVAEAGFPGFEERSWVGFFAPARAPRAVISLLNKEINAALAEPDVISRVDALGMDRHPGSVAEFTRHVHSEVAKWAKMVKLTGVKVE